MGDVPEFLNVPIKAALNGDLLVNSQPKIQKSSK